MKQINFTKMSRKTRRQLDIIGGGCV